MRLEKGKSFPIIKKIKSHNFSYRLQNDVARLERKFCELQIENRNLKTNYDAMKTSYANVLYEFNSDTDSEHTIDTMMKNLNQRRSHT